MSQKKYYSARTGKLTGMELSLPVLKKLFMSIYNQLDRDGYFQKYFGFYCVDADQVAGTLGQDIYSVVFLAIRKDNLWPIDAMISDYSEDDLFDMIEFLHDHCSKPLTGNYHSWNDCGMHYDTFDDQLGRIEFRTKINALLADFKDGFEVSTNGELLTMSNENLAPLYEAVLPSVDEDNVKAKVDLAVSKFRRHKATVDERRDALRDLADVLEYLRPEIKQTLMINDEKDIYNLANNFGLRHHNLNQKNKYDRAIWYSWIFYYYLATIHAVVRLIDKQKSIK